MAREDFFQFFGQFFLGNFFLCDLYVLKIGSDLGTLREVRTDMWWSICQFLRDRKKGRSEAGRLEGKA